MDKLNKIIQNHRTIRSFSDKEVPEDMLDTILVSAQAMPTSNNHQDVSVIVVKDKIKKSILAELSGNQEHIKKAPVFLVFVADLYKTYLACKKNNKEQNMDNYLDNIITPTFDSGISLGAAIISAESLGLGVTAIGGIRNNIMEVSKILELPEYTMPLVGLCIGFPYNIPQKKPRLPFPTFKHDEVYKKDSIDMYINEYDEIMQNYLISINREQEVNWSYRTSLFMSAPGEGSFLKEFLISQNIISKEKLK